MTPIKSILLLGLLVVGLGLQAQEETKPCPCCTEAHRAFDFWEGSWEVYDANEKFLGGNEIISLQGQCILQENWTSGAGKYTGTSYNFYDSGNDEWNQIWIDNQGGHLKLKGNLEGNSMVMRSEVLPTGEGNTVLNQITWTPDNDGNVRQVWEISEDEGATWKVVFDGIYKPKP